MRLLLALIYIFTAQVARALATGTNATIPTTTAAIPPPVTVNTDNTLIITWFKGANFAQHFRGSHHALENGK